MFPEWNVDIGQNVKIGYKDFGVIGDKVILKIIQLLSMYLTELQLLKRMK